MKNLNRIGGTLIAICVLIGISIPTVGQSDGAIEPYNRVLQRLPLKSEMGEEVQIREILFAPGWTAPRHYHNSDLFIYVIEGEFEVDMDGDGLRTYRSGESLRMKPNTHMYARNPSTVHPLKLAVFQVGYPDAPFVVPVE